MTPVEVGRGRRAGHPRPAAHRHLAAGRTSRARLNATGRALADTDWHIHELYAGLLPGATTVRATFHRYVIDANRGPDDASLYPGQNTTGLCPLTDFDGRPIWREGMEPDADEIAARHRRASTPPIMPRWRPRSSGCARGTASRSSTTATRSAAASRSCSRARCRTSTSAPTTARACAPERSRRAVQRVCRAADRLHLRLNGRFKGGWTTRHYGDPARACTRSRWSWRSRPTSPPRPPPWTYDAERADRAARRTRRPSSKPSPRSPPDLGGPHEPDPAARTPATSTRRPGRRSPRRAG